MQIPMDPSDPIVALLALALVEVLKKGVLPKKALDRVSPIMPIIVFLVAIALRAAYDASMTEEGLTWASAFRGLAAAGVAVLTHAQFRSVAKALTAEEGAEGVEPLPPSSRVPPSEGEGA